MSREIKEKKGFGVTKFGVKVILTSVLLIVIGLFMLSDLIVGSVIALMVAISVLISLMEDYYEEELFTEYEFIYRKSNPIESEIME